jgi:hypothetical protein
MIKELLKERAALEERLKHIDEAIKHLRAICEHQWIPGGNDSHYHYQQCARCGKTRKI